MAGRLVRPRPPAEALREVYRDNVEAVYAFFAYSVGYDTAEDLDGGHVRARGAIVVSLRSRARRARTWILAIARNVLTDHFRRQSHRNAVSLDAHPALAASLVSSDDPAARYLSADAVREWLRGARAARARGARAAVRADLPASEIARTSISPRPTSTRSRRARCAGSTLNSRARSSPAAPDRSRHGSVWYRTTSSPPRSRTNDGTRSVRFTVTMRQSRSAWAPLPPPSWIGSRPAAPSAMTMAASATANPTPVIATRRRPRSVRGRRGMSLRSSARTKSGRGTGRPAAEQAFQVFRRQGHRGPVRASVDVSDKSRDRPGPSAGPGARRIEASRCSRPSAAASGRR